MPTNADETTRLDEFDKIEWFDVCKKLVPGLTVEEYEVLWDKFHTEKDARLQNMQYN